METMSSSSICFLDVWEPTYWVYIGIAFTCLIPPDWKHFHAIFIYPVGLHHLLLKLSSRKCFFVPF
uniref:Putative ovule protein n=1 Tax=Solanum chacoense TaxID=4108 RepID=A0A0V0IC81_SOLCH